MSEDEDECRCFICLEPGDLFKPPCDVCGKENTTVWVHKKCAEQWLAVPTPVPLCPTCLMPARVSTKTKTVKTFVTFASHVRSKVSSNRRAALAIYAFTVSTLLFLQYFLGRKEDLFVNDGAISAAFSRIALTLVGAFAWLVVLLALTRNLSDLYVKHYSAFAERSYIWTTKP